MLTYLQNSTKAPKIYFTISSSYDLFFYYELPLSCCHTCKPCVYSVCINMVCNTSINVLSAYTCMYTAVSIQYSCQSKVLQINTALSRLTWECAGWTGLLCGCTSGAVVPLRARDGIRHYSTTVTEESLCTVPRRQRQAHEGAELAWGARGWTFRSHGTECTWQMEKE